MLNNVKDFGAVGDGVQDDRDAIQRAIIDAAGNSKAGVLFPAGTYRVSRATVSGSRWSIDLNGVQDFLVTGEGPKSVVKLVDTTDPQGTGDWHVFILRNNCRRVVFKDLVIDGNRARLTKPKEQSHGIEVEPGTEDLVVDGCILRECFGDGMRLLGSPGQNVRRVRIQNTLFQSNKRSGLAIQRALEQVMVVNCTFDSTVSDQSIDFEPTGHDGPTDLLIHGCIINHTNRTPAVTLSGISGPEPLVRCKFTDNIVTGGHVFCTDVSHLTIQNNTIHATDLASVQRIPIEVQRGGDSLIVSGNLLITDDSSTRAVISLDAVNQRQVTRALVANNLCFARSGVGIQCLSSDDVAIDGNMIVATGPCGNGIFLRSESSDMDNISVRDNDVTVKGDGTWRFGVRVAATSPHHIGEISITGNSITGAEKGIQFEGPGFQETPVCALNRIADDVSTPIAGMQVLPSRSVIVGGAASRGSAGRWLVGKIAASDQNGPNDQVVGDVGDIFQNLDGEPGRTLWVKESGKGTTTGWTAK